jgi:ferritin-like metal-binding protein YciE
MKETLEELLVEELRDLYDAEKQLVRALPKMAKAASAPELQQAFQTHLEVTKGQVQRIEQVFELLGQKAKSKPCKAMKGLVEEGQEIMQEDFDESMMDSALIGAAQKVEHYEIAGYGTARTLAQALGRKDAAQLLQETLDEEGATDKQLTAIAKGLLKEAVRAASRASMDIGGEEESGSRRGRSSNGGRSQSSGRQPSGRSSGSKAKSQSARLAGAPGTAGRAASRSKSGEGGGKSSGGSITTTDHEEIQRWAEERGGKPACVRGTGRKGDTGMIRIDFPGYSGGDSLQEIEWDEFFEKFDANNLALVYQEKTAGGQKSNFNKLVKR